MTGPPKSGVPYELKERQFSCISYSMRRLEDTRVGAEKQKNRRGLEIFESHAWAQYDCAGRSLHHRACRVLSRGKEGT